MGLHEFVGDGPIAAAREADRGGNLVDAKQVAKRFGKGDLASPAGLNEGAVDVEEDGDHRIQAGVVSCGDFGAGPPL